MSIQVATTKDGDNVKITATYKPEQLDPVQAYMHSATKMAKAVKAYWEKAQGHEILDTAVAECNNLPETVEFLKLYGKENQKFVNHAIQLGFKSYIEGK
ncbi:hypothetical protein Tiera_045 [Polaromonas phage Tiera]|nr:hypothetical protein Tiera_045 [Polaromonas phage Tiera]